MYPRDVSFFIVEPVVWKEYVTGYGRCQETKDGHIFIYFKDKKPIPGVIAHECFHAVEFIMEAIGQTFGLGDNTNESFAYLLQYLVTECHEFIQ